MRLMAAGKKVEHGKASLLRLYETMLVIRTCETALSKLFADGEIPGFIHLSLGQEAVAAGICSVLGEGDTLATTHRGHGHVLARGMELESFFKELMGREGGICGGRSGSMHVADMSLGILGANGIVGAGIPLALGSALAHQTRQTGGVAVAFFGDGAMAEGVLHEALNMAALWKLPMMFVCENNGWSEFSPTERQFKGSLEGLGTTFGIRHLKVDGNDVLATAAAAVDVVKHAREKGPAIIECMTTRVRGHFEGDPQKYRSTEETTGLSAKDPIRRAAAKLAEMGVSENEFKKLIDDVDERVRVAITAARDDPLPGFDAALADVYTRGENTHHG
jgi:pyruvate dehydrogenase E1 component alpha subunit